MAGASLHTHTAVARLLGVS